MSCDEEFKPEALDTCQAVSDVLTATATKYIVSN